MKKNKVKPPNAAASTPAIQGRLQELLEQGRRLRQQIEAISGDVDFPLTRGSDGDPRLRSNPAQPDQLNDRPRRPAEKRR